MIDFTPTTNGTLTLAQFAAQFTPSDLRQFTYEMIDEQQRLIAHCSDADVTYAPSDPQAHDSFAANPEEIDLAWTLGHVIVHVTASSEEAAAIACELARGVPWRGGRSRAEVAWETVTTIAQCRHRLEESRRMRLASMDMWPLEPALTNTYKPSPNAEPRNATMRFLQGLKHDSDHLKQIAEIVRQAQAK